MGGKQGVSLSDRLSRVYHCGCHEGFPQTCSEIFSPDASGPAFAASASDFASAAGGFLARTSMFLMRKASPSDTKPRGTPGQKKLMSIRSPGKGQKLTDYKDCANRFDVGAHDGGDELFGNLCVD